MFVASPVACSHWLITGWQKVAANTFGYCIRYFTIPIFAPFYSGLAQVPFCVALKPFSQMRWNQNSFALLVSGVIMTTSLIFIFPLKRRSKMHKIHKI